MRTESKLPLKVIFESKMEKNYHREILQLNVM